jgi:hypothetical protein
MRLKKLNITFGAAYVLGLLVVLGLDLVLPDKYFYDSVRLSDIVWEGGGGWNNSFVSTAELYRILSFGYVAPRWGVGLVNYTIAVVVMRWVYQASSRQWARGPMVLALVWLMVTAVYLGMYSKEIFTFLLSAGVVWYCQSRKFTLLAVLTLLFMLYGVFVRKYWLLIGCECVLFYAIYSLPFRLITRGVITTLVLITVSFLFNELQGHYITDIRGFMVTGRIGDVDSKTIVFNFFTNVSPLHDVANNFLGWLRFLVPVTAIRFGGIQHVAFGLWQTFNSALLAFMLWRIGVLKSRGKEFNSVVRNIRLAVSYLFAFTYVHAAFDGDFGTYLRHQTAALPVYFYLIVILANEVAPRGRERLLIPGGSAAGRKLRRAF